MILYLLQSYIISNDLYNLLYSVDNMNQSIDSLFFLSYQLFLLNNFQKKKRCQPVNWNYFLYLKATLAIDCIEDKYVM